MGAKAVNVLFGGEDKALLTIVEACVVQSPMTVEDVAGITLILAAFARHGGKVSSIENYIKSYVGEERYQEMLEEMNEAIRQYVNNRTVDLPSGLKALKP
jgi:hypothetical protein